MCIEKIGTFFANDRIYLSKGVADIAGEIVLSLVTLFSASQTKRTSLRPRGELNAGFGECSLRVAAVQKSPGIYDDRRANAGIGHRSNDRDFYAGACCVAQVAASIQARGTCARGQ